MSDTKLREKADALIAFTQQGPRFIAWVQAVTDALAPATEKAKPGLKDSLWALLSSLRLWKSKGELAMHPSRLDGMIAAVLEDYGGVFIDAPAPVERSTDPNCGPYTHHWNFGFCHTCNKPGRDQGDATAPEKAAKVSAFPVGNCVVCGELVAPYNKHAKHEGGYTCQRQQPAPPEPAAREMPEAVRDAVDTLSSGVPSYPTWRQYADTLESWWRNLAQPVAVGMSPALEKVLESAELAGKHYDDWGLLSAVVAVRQEVRQQAAQGRKVGDIGPLLKLAKDRYDILIRSGAHEASTATAWRLAIDAAEGKGEGRG